jgi:hypothetical protein
MLGIFNVLVVQDITIHFDFFFSCWNRKEEELIRCPRENANINMLLRVNLNFSGLYLEVTGIMPSARYAKLMSSQLIGGLNLP